jgi:hypothetical protein
MTIGRQSRFLEPIKRLVSTSEPTISLRSERGSTAGFGTCLSPNESLAATRYGPNNRRKQPCSVLNYVIQNVIGIAGVFGCGDHPRAYAG